MNPICPKCGKGMVWKNLPGKPPHFLCPCGNRLSKDQAVSQQKLKEHRSQEALSVQNQRKLLVNNWDNLTKKISEGSVVVPDTEPECPVVVVVDDFLTPDLSEIGPEQVISEWYSIPSEE